MGWFGPSKYQVLRQRWRCRITTAGSVPSSRQMWIVGVIKDVERLKTLFDLFAAVLDQLCQLGSAYKRDPGVRL